MSQLDIIIKKYDKSLLWLIVALCGIGTVMLYSASSFKSLYQTSGLTDTIYLQSHLKKNDDWILWHVSFYRYGL